MTKALYLEDSYIRSFIASVLGSEDGFLFLDQSAFYPGGGGQPSDIGQVATEDAVWQVSRVKRVKGQIGHFVDGPGPGVGTLVHGEIDWQQRYQLMRTHTAMHILCGVIWRDYGAAVTGGDMQPLNGRMDFEFETMRKELVEEIEESVNREVAAARDVLIKILPREEAFQIPDLIRTKINLLPEGIKEVRTIEIVGLDLQADGGTHVANTREVGHIHIADYKSKGKINKRIYVSLDP